jgi:ABC-2 type transport system permease protein
MKKVLHISRNELYTLFYSPIAWVMMILFIIMASADYVQILQIYTGYYQQGGPSLAQVQNLTYTLSAAQGGFLWRFFGLLYLFLPLITMVLITRELSSGTIKLLYSSPVKIWEVVLGKYLGVIVFTFCLIILIAIVLFALSLSIINPDYAQLLASLFGVFLILATYAAIGLFISSVTSYQTVAAIITLTLFGLLARVGSLWQEVDMIREVTNYLDITGKSRNFIIGFLNLRDFTYFLVIISAFLMFTIIKMKSATESISWFNKTIRYVTVIATLFFIGYIFNKREINIYVDSTRDKIYTISEATQAKLAQLDGELEITAYANLFHNISFFRPSRQLILERNFWERYIRFKPDIKLKYVYYYDLDPTHWLYRINPGKSIQELAQKDAESHVLNLSLFLSPEEISKQIDVREEDYRSFFVLKYKGKKVILRTFDDMIFAPSENEIIVAINRLIDAPPTISFLTDEIERGPFSGRARDYKPIASSRGSRVSLINQGYNFDTLSLKGNNVVPTDIAALVIADPRTPFTTESLEKIDRYIDEGGNLFILTEPDRKEITKPILDKLGLSLYSGMLVQPNDRYSSDIIFSLLSDTAKNLSPVFSKYLNAQVKFYGDTLPRVVLGGASALQYKSNEFKIEPLLYSDSSLGWNRLTPINQDSIQMPVKKLAGDVQEKFTTAIRMSRMVNGKEQRIIVVTDSDFMTSNMFGVGPVNNSFESTNVNMNFALECFRYFSYGKFPPDTYRPDGTDNAFTIKVEDIPKQKVIFYWIIPGMLAICGSVILIRRKRK